MTGAFHREKAVAPLKRVVLELSVNTEGPFHRSSGGPIEATCGSRTRYTTRSFPSPKKAVAPLKRDVGVVLVLVGELSAVFRLRPH